MKIKDIFTDESKWTTGAMARNTNGEEVPFNSDEAVCYCLLGAAHKCYTVSVEVDKGNTKYYEIRNRMFEFVQKKYNIIGLMGFNDGIAKFKDVRQLVEELDI